MHIVRSIAMDIILIGGAVCILLLSLLLILSVISSFYLLRVTKILKNVFTGLSYLIQYPIRAVVTLSQIFSKSFLDSDSIKSTSRQNKKTTSTKKATTKK